MKTHRLRYVDPLLLGATLLLICIGTVMIYSSSSLMAAEKYASHVFFLKRHLLMLGLGSVAMLCALLMPIRLLKKISLPVYGLCILMLLGVLLTSMGVESKHATRWINLGGFRFQPSEMIKPWFILFTAGYIERMGPKVQKFKEGLLPLLMMQGFVLMLILQQPDFGTTVTMGCVFIFMIFIAGAKWEHLAGLCSTGLLAMGYLIFSADYRRRRFLSFLHPWDDPQGDGFQMIQSLVAFERGGLTGQGLGDGTQKLLYLPEAHTDFIFSVIGEELGFVGCATVIILFIIIMVQGIRLSIRIQDTYASTLAFGITVLITVQSLFNIGVVMGMLPTKGLTLPLVSYGGSSLISMMFCLGLLLSLSSMISHQRAKVSRVL